MSKEIENRIRALEEADEMQEMPVPVRCHLVYPEERKIDPPLTDDEKAGNNPFILVQVKDMSKRHEE